MMALADDDPVKMDAIARMPIIEYFLLLNKRLKDAAQAKREHGKRSAKYNH